MENTNLQQEDTVSADRKERIVFDQNTGKSRKVSSVVSRQNFNNKKYGNRNSPIEFVDGKEPPPQEAGTADKKLKKEDMNIVTKILEAKKKKTEHCAEEVVEVDSELTEALQEVLNKDAASADWIHDFVHSENPKFEGKSKKERIRMALGAYYAKQRNEEYDAHVTEACKSIVKAATKKDDVPFDGPYTKTPDTVTDKSGAKHTPMSRVRHLARQAMKDVQKEEVEIEEAIRIKDPIRAKVGDVNYGKKDGSFQGSMERKQLAAAAKDRRKVTAGSGVSGFNSKMTAKPSTTETGRVRAVKEGSDHDPWHDAQENKKSADSARKQGDTKAYHMHMADHHENMAQWSMNRGRSSVANQHQMKADQHQDWAHGIKEEVEQLEESPIEKAPRKFSGMYDKVEAPGMRTQAEKAALKAAAKKINDRSKQQANEETDMSEKLSYTQFVEQLNEYNSKDGVYRHKGTYGGNYVDPEGADDADDKPKAPAAPAVKKGRGRPAGSYGTYKARSAETKAAAAAKSAASKAANKAK